MRMAAIGLLIGLAILGDTVRAQTPVIPPCRVSEGPTYLNGPQRDKEKTSVVVFVHGILSNAVGAWSYDARTSWPCLLLREPMFSSSNIYLYAYRTDPLGKSPGIDKVAAQLLKDLDVDEVLQHAHITIVAHSMGGLVVSRMLLKLQEDAARKHQIDRIKLLQFYGTPATGADIANVASLLSDNEQFDEMRKQESQQALLDKWAAVKWPFHWYCVAEGKKTGWAWVFGTQIVEPASAKALCRDRPADAFDVLDGYDHVSMVKPASLQDAPHRSLRRGFKSCVVGSINLPAASSAAATPDGQLVLGMMSRLSAHLRDEGESGRIGNLQAVVNMLYQSAGWGNRYFLPKRQGVPGLLEADYELQSERVFANDFVGFLEPHARVLKPAWVTRVGALESRVPDGRFVELRNLWKDSATIQDSDYAVALDIPDAKGKVLVVAGIQPDATGLPQARIRGYLLVPPEPQNCI